MNKFRVGQDTIAGYQYVQQAGVKQNRSDINNEKSQVKRVPTNPENTVDNQAGSLLRKPVFQRLAHAKKRD